MSDSCIELLQHLGIDGTSRDEIRDLRDSIQWVGKQRKAEAQREADALIEHRELRSRRYALLYALLATALGGAGTWIGAHASHITGWFK